MSTTIINHNGQSIIYSDYTDLNEEKFMAKLDDEATFLEKRTDPLPMLINVTGTRTNESTFDKMKAQGKLLSSKTTKRAIVGVNGVVMNMILKGFNTITRSGVRPFKDIDEAKDWLLS